MAITFATVKRFPPQKGGIRRGLVDITLDASYSAGGWTVTAANLTLNVLRDLRVPAHKAGYHLEWDQVNGKIKAYQEQDTAAASKEIDAADLSTQVIRCEYVGS